MFPRDSELFWRCSKAVEDLLHFCSCNKHHRLWSEVCRYAQKFTDHEIPLDPALFLLQYYIFPSLSYYRQVLLSIATSS